MDDKRFVLFSCCIPVKGYNRALIYDIQRGGCIFIPLEIIDILNELTEYSIDNVLSRYNKENIETIQEYIEYLKKEEYGMYIHKKLKQQLPLLSDKILLPSIITHTVIEYSKMDYIETLNTQLNSVYCRYVEILFYEYIPYQELQEVLRILEQSCLLSINIKVNFNLLTNLSDYIALLKIHPKLIKIDIYNFPNKIKEESLKVESDQIQLHSRKLSSIRQCGKIGKKYFTINPLFYFESINYNNCLYKKLAIDRNGYIKNCIASKQHFGHLENKSIFEVVQSLSFQEIWNINKDKVNVCKDCEFRYMCSDCRYFIKDNNNPFSQPNKCTYNPYISKWKGEKDYVTIEECTIKVGTEIKADNKKLAYINKEIWGD